MISYRGVFITKLEEAIMLNPDKPLSYILMGFLNKKNLKGKHFFDCSDEEIYSSLEIFISDMDSDEPLSEAEFNEWRCKY